MKNPAGLSKCTTILNGVLFCGKRSLEVHSSAVIEVFTIMNKANEPMIDLTVEEVKALRDLLVRLYPA